MMRINAKWIGLAASLILQPLNVFAAPAPNNLAPEFSARTTDGADISLSDYRGKIVILEWTNHKCPFVRKHYETGNMQKLQEDAERQGVVWLSIISSAPGKQGHVSATKANALTRQRGAKPTAVIRDPEGDIGRLYDVRTTPHMFVIAPSGDLVFSGAVDDNPSHKHEAVEGTRNHVRAAMEELLAGHDVTIQKARPYGCNVKY